MARETENEIVREAVAEIRNASLSIHSTLYLVARGKVNEAQALVLVACQNRRIDSALNFLKREGL